MDDSGLGMPLPETALTEGGEDKQAAPVQADSPGQQQEVSNKPLTADDVAAILDQKFNTWNREQQGLRRKMEDRIKADVQSQLETMRKIGIEPTNAQVQALHESTRQRIEEEAIGGTVEGNPPAQSQQQPPQDGSNPVAQTVNAMAMELAKEYGVGIDQGEEEAKLIDFSTPVKYLRSLEKALQAKKQRLASQQPQRTASPAARTPTITGGATPGNPLADIVDPDQLYSLATKRR